MQKTALRNGVVTFLDVLGWRGIWQRESEPLAALKTLMDLARSKMDKSRGRGELMDTGRVLCVSDTIVLVTYTPEEAISAAIEVQGETAGVLLREGLRHGLPLRGATTYGRLSVADDEKLPSAYGPAIDEAAAWYERCAWIGVHLTPSACYALGGQSVKHWVRYPPPLSGEQQFDTLCVDWRPAADGGGEPEKMSIVRDFLNTAPILPEILSKYENTLRFLSHEGAQADDSGGTARGDADSAQTSKDRSSSST